MNSARKDTAASARRRTALAVLALAALALGGAELDQNGTVTLRGFRTQGRSEDGTRWFLEGREAVVRGTVFDVSGAVMRLVSEDGRTARITADQCRYYQESGLVESEAPVRVDTGDVALAGVGFDVLVAERRLRIRNAVRMEVPRIPGGGAGLGLPGTEGPRDRKAEPPTAEGAPQPPPPAPAPEPQTGAQDG